MGDIKIEKDINKIPELIKIIEDLQHTEIRIGIFGKEDSHMLAIASANEFGCTIKPKGKRLAIPLNKQAKGKSPREFSNLYPIRTKDGHLYLARDKSKGRIEFMYWLATEVHIPERSFIRGGFDANVGEFSKHIANLLKKVLLQQITLDSFYTEFGDYAVGRIQKFLTELRDPPNKIVTINAKDGKTNPLVNTGNLKKSISYEVVKI